MTVAKMLGVALAAGVTTSLLVFYVPWPLLFIGGLVIAILYMIHMIYELELDKAQLLEDLKRQRETYYKK